MPNARLLQAVYAGVVALMLVVFSIVEVAIVASPSVWLTAACFFAATVLAFIPQPPGLTMRDALITSTDWSSSLIRSRR